MTKFLPGVIIFSRKLPVRKGSESHGHRTEKIAAQNKKAFHDYFVLDRYEAGIELCGTEVKSIRQGKLNLKDSWCSIVDGELFVNGMHISPYEHGNIFNRDPLRVRRLLMHKREIMRLLGQTKQEGLTLVPLSVYLSKGAPRLRLGCARVKSSMTSAKRQRRKTPHAISSAA